MSRRQQDSVFVVFGGAKRLIFEVEEVSVASRSTYYNCCPFFWNQIQAMCIQSPGLSIPESTMHFSHFTRSMPSHNQVASSQSPVHLLLQ